MTRSVAIARREMMLAARMLRSRRGMRTALMGYERKGLLTTTGIMLIQGKVVVTRTRAPGASLVPGVYGRFVTTMPMPGCDHSDPASVSAAMMSVAEALPADMEDPMGAGRDEDDATRQLDDIARAWALTTRHVLCHYVTGPFGPISGSGIVFVPDGDGSGYDHPPEKMVDLINLTTRTVRIKREEKTDSDDLGIRRILNIELEAPRGWADQIQDPIERLRAATALPGHLMDSLS
jgi:hypothetical protein